MHPSRLGAFGARSHLPPACRSLCWTALFRDATNREQHGAVVQQDHWAVGFVREEGRRRSDQLLASGLPVIARANDDPRAFSLLAMLGLFETGYLYGAARGFFGYNRGHLSRDADHMAQRLADAMYRGAKLAWHLDDHGRSDETDLLATDWFEHADRQLEEVRADFGLLPKSSRTLAAGSVSPWEPGGISPFQDEQGRRAAEADGHPYESYGASPPEARVET